MWLRRHARCLAWVCLAVGFFAVCAACTASHDVEANGQTSAGGSADSASAGSSARAGSGASAGAGAASCGDASDCEDANLFGTPVPGSCTSDGKCGMDLSGFGLGTGCAELDAPGVQDSACPSQSIGGFFTLQGCCRPDGTCGAMDTFVGLGCTSAAPGDAVSCEP